MKNSNTESEGVSSPYLALVLLLLKDKVCVYAPAPFIQLSARWVQWEEQILKGWQLLCPVVDGESQAHPVYLS